MPSVVKALLLNLEAFLADNGVRRSVGSFSLNYSTPGGQFVTTQVTLNPGESRSLAFNVPTAALVVRTTRPLSAECTHEDGSFAITVSKSLVLDHPLTQLVLENEGADIAQVVVIQC